MSNTLKQSIDAAFVAYLRPLLPGTMKVYPSCTNEALQFPCVVVRAGAGENESEDAGFNGHRKINVSLVVMVEEADELDEASVKMKTSLQRIDEACGEVMNAVAKAQLEALLNDVNSPGVKFSLADVADDPDPVIEGRVFVGTINIKVIANQTVT